jgi:hypothetical protein
MVLWRQYLVLFGGFIDTGARTTYLQDLWMFDTAQYKWFEISQNDLKRPPARSGFSLISTPEGVALYGGYCKRYVKGQRTQGEVDGGPERMKNLRTNLILLSPLRSSQVLPWRTLGF